MIVAGNIVKASGCSFVSYLKLTLLCYFNFVKPSVAEQDLFIINTD